MTSTTAWSGPASSKFDFYHEVTETQNPPDPEHRCVLQQPQEVHLRVFAAGAAQGCVRFITDPVAGFGLTYQPCSEERMPIRTLMAVLCSFLLCLQVVAQTPANPGFQPEVLPPPDIVVKSGPSKVPLQPATTALSDEVVAVPSLVSFKAFGLESATAVHLRTLAPISSSKVHAGETLEFEVTREVRVDDLVVIPKGGIAWAKVTTAKHKKTWGREGRLVLQIDAVRLADGEKAPLRATSEVRGDSRGMTTYALLVGGLFTAGLSAPFAFMVHGKDAVVAQGTEFFAYVDGNMPLNRANFEPLNVAATSNANSATAEITSNPAGAEIELDGKFIGNTPSTVPLPIGDHRVMMSKPGFKSWERTISVTGGVVKVSADLAMAAAER